MAKEKKELTLKQKNIKEFNLCKKKIEKIKDILLQDIMENKENTIFLTNTMDDLIMVFNNLIELVEKLDYKDENNELD